MDAKPILITILFIVIIVLISGIMTVFENNTGPTEKLVINDLNIVPTQYNHYKLVGHVTPKKDMCLKWFETEVSKRYKVCREYSEFSDKELSRKWSN